MTISDIIPDVADAFKVIGNLSAGDVRCDKYQ
jgi:hypothetical protein